MLIILASKFLNEQCEVVGGIAKVMMSMHAESEYLNIIYVHVH